VVGQFARAGWPNRAAGAFRCHASYVIRVLTIVACAFVSHSQADEKADLAGAKEILRQAGADDRALVSYENMILGMSPSARAQAYRSLRESSPVSVARLLEFMRLDSEYVFGPASLPQEGVPRGDIMEFEFISSQVFPGTRRTLQVYVPAQYRPDKPACVYVGLDGLLFAAPTVFDNLIHAKEMPITIAIGVASGQVQAARPLENPRFNRSLEFDTLNGDLGRFLLDEVFPEVEKRRTPGGLPIRLSKSANDRAAGGISTGGIGAFTLAWEHPDQFRRVFSASGTFVGMRGGDQYPVLVRKTEPKPIRVFIQDGAGDHMDGLLGEVGDWWMSNQAMQRALDFSGYQVAHVWGNGPHGSRQGAVVFPDAMRWLWRDWPKPVTAARDTKNVFLQEVLRTGELWESIPSAPASITFITADARGTVIAFDTRNGGGWTLNDQGWRKDLRLAPYSEVVFGAAGRAYAIDSRHHRLVAFSAESASEVALGISATKVAVTHDGHLYAAEEKEDGASALWLVRPGGDKVLLDSQLPRLSAITLTPDELWLSVASASSRWGYVYRVESDYTVNRRQQFYWLHVPDAPVDPGPNAWVMDREGRLYAGTQMGVQILDRNGRVRAILPVDGGAVGGVTFGGSTFDTLYVLASDNKIYRRRLKVQGVRPGEQPIKLPAGNGA